VRRLIEQLVQAAAVDLDAFYAQRVPMPCTNEVLLVISADGNGIVMRPEGLRPATRKAAEGKKRGRGVFRTRLASGGKPCRKRMAALACVYDAAPAPRRPHDVTAKWLTGSVACDAKEVIRAARCWPIPPPRPARARASSALTSPSTTTTAPSPARKARPRRLGRRALNEAPTPSWCASPPPAAGPARARALCTTGRRRQFTLPLRDLAEAQAAARAAEQTIPFQADYARRAGVEGTMHQAASHGARRTRYRGLPRTRLDHVYMACALNLLRLHAYWTGTPLDRRRTSHLARLEPSLAA
jgi:hypothetical protein